MFATFQKSDVYHLDTRRVRCILVALFGLGTGHALATDPPSKNDFSQGKWVLKPDKSNFCGRAVPQKSVREIVDSGWGLISVHWTGVQADGSSFETWYVYRYDGQNYPAGIGKPASESITWKLVNPHRVEFTHWSKEGRVTQQLARIVSSDGQTMTQTTRYISEKSTGCVVSQVFLRE